MPVPAWMLAAGSQAANVGLQEGSNLLNFRRNKKFWQQRFDQASYPNQVKLMKKAGLNPALMYKGAGGAPSIGGAPEAQAGDYSNVNLAETSKQLQDQEAGIILKRKMAITEGAKGDKTKAEAEYSQNLANTSKQLLDYNLQKAKADAISAQATAHVKDKTKHDEVNIKTAQLLHAQKLAQKTGSEADLAKAKDLYQDWLNYMAINSGLTPGGLHSDFMIWFDNLSQGMGIGKSYGKQLQDQAIKGLLNEKFKD